jgi:hypothetical protein
MEDLQHPRPGYLTPEALSLPEALRTADLIRAVQVVMCLRQNRDEVEIRSTLASPAFMTPA